MLPGQHTNAYLKQLIENEEHHRQAYGYRRINDASIQAFHNAVTDTNEYWDYPGMRSLHKELRALTRHMLYSGFQHVAHQRWETYKILLLEVTRAPRPLEFDISDFHKQWRQTAGKFSVPAVAAGLEAIIIEHLHGCYTFAAHFAQHSPKTFNPPLEFMLHPDDQPWLEDLLGDFNAKLAEPITTRFDQQLSPSSSYTH